MTGAAAGIGFHTAKSLAAMGCDVYLGIRGAERAERIAKEIEVEATKELINQREARKAAGGEGAVESLPNSIG